MKKVASILLVYFAVIFPAKSDTPTVGLVETTDTTITYNVIDSDGIRQLTFTYGLIGGEDVVFTYPNCPTEVRITVKKEYVDPDDEENDQQLAQLAVEDCTSNILGENRNEVRIFLISESFEFEIADGVLHVQPPPAAPVWFWWVMIVWALLTVYLLWWRIFGPFRKP